jgi:5'-3' exonuclease
VLRQDNVEYVVAPYEADAQMAFLARNGHVDLVITEDSDLIAYGCPQVESSISKLEQKVNRRLPSRLDFEYVDIRPQIHWLYEF